MCTDVLHFGGATCTQLTSLMDTRATAFAKPVAKNSPTAACHKPRVKSTGPQSHARASLRSMGDNAASTEERETQ